MREVALDPLLRCETVTHADPPGAPWPHRVGDLGPFTVLDVAATRDAGASAVTLTVVNRSPDAAVRTRFEVGRPVAPPGVTMHLVHGESPDAVNTFERPDLVSVRTCPVAAAGPAFEVELPAHSFTCLEVPLAP